MAHTKNISGFGVECDCECCKVADTLNDAVQDYLAKHEDSSNWAMAGGLAKLVAVQLLTDAVGRRMKLPDGCDTVTRDNYTAKDVDRAVKSFEELINTELKFFERLRREATADPMKAKTPERTM